MEHYYTGDPTSRSNEKEIVYEVNGQPFSMITDRGVFSIDRVDHGTDILIRTVLEQEETLAGTVIDLGCGYGPVAIALGNLRPESSWLMIDVNERAMALAYRNAQKNGLITRVKIGTEEALAAKGLQPECAACVITNPPIRAGKETIYALFERSLGWLKSGGSLYAVIQKKQGADSAQKKLAALFGNCEVVERQSGYHVLKAVKQ